MPPSPQIYIEQPSCHVCKQYHICVLDGICAVPLSLRVSNMSRRMIVRRPMKLRQDSALATMRPRPSREGLWTLFDHSYTLPTISHRQTHQGLPRHTTYRKKWLKRTAILPRSRATRRIRITTNSHNNRCPKRMHPPFPMRQLR